MAILMALAILAMFTDEMQTLTGPEFIKMKAEKLRGRPNGIQIPAKYIFILRPIQF